MLLSDQRSTSDSRRAVHEMEDLDWELESLGGLEESDNQPYLPSPWEIEMHCREIRKGWSESEYRKRAGCRVEPLEIASTPCRVSLFDFSVLDFS